MAELFDEKYERMVHSMADLMVYNYQMIERAMRSKASLEDRGVVLTGFTDLDNITGGLNCGNLILLCSSSDSGAYPFILNLAVNTRGAHKNLSSSCDSVGCIFVSLALTPELFSKHALSVLSGVPNSHLTSGRLSEKERKKVSAASRALAESSIHVVSDPDDTAFDIDPDVIRSGNSQLTIDEIILSVRELVKENKYLKLVIVDGFESLNDNTSQKNREAKYAEIMERLKRVAGESGVAIMLYLREPPLNTLDEVKAYSESISSRSDTILFLRKNGSTTSELLVAKHLHGNAPTPEVQMARFHKPQEDFICPLIGSERYGKIVNFPAR